MTNARAYGGTIAKLEDADFFSSVLHNTARQRGAQTR